MTVGSYTSVDCEGLHQEISESESATWLEAICVLFWKITNMSTFCPCSKNLFKVKIKSHELVYLMEGILRVYKVEFVKWLLLLIVTQVFNGEAQRG